jgi:hypothetical protein
MFGPSPAPSTKAQHHRASDQITAPVVGAWPSGAMNTLREPIPESSESVASALVGAIVRWKSTRQCDVRVFV